jgi:chloramphenicol-sensitive protein RarD
MLAGTGTWTAGALLLFAAGARRLPLNITGMLQYIAPTMTFVLAVWYFHEPMSGGRWVGFGFVWVALVLFSIDAWRIRPSGARAQMAREERARDAVIAAEAI